VVARKGRDFTNKLVICAHIDTKQSTPGALDNRTGVAILLGLAEVLVNYDGEMGIEIVTFNREDYYSTPGQKLYLQENTNTMDSIILAIKMDLAGHKESHPIYSLFESDQALETAVHATLGSQPNIAEGPQWYQK
jgi:aminopeptidase YwaD